MRLKKILGKLASAKEKQTPHQGHPNKNGKKIHKNEKLPDYKKQSGMGEKLHLPDCLLACSLGERNKFTIEKLNSSRSALAEKGASDSEAHEFIAHSVCGA